MPRRILVIGGAGSAIEWSRVMDECLVERRDWASFSPSHLATCTPDLVVSTATDDGAAALDLFEWLRAHPLAAPVLAILPPDPAAPLLTLASRIAADFIVWPAEADEIRARVTRILGATPNEVNALHERLIAEIGLQQIVGRNPAFRRVIGQIPLLARSHRPVLITGETGTGKELCARALHHLGRRRHFPFIPVECGGFPEHLFENEMFGHERGAFTDAHRRQRGLIAMAEGGTLFLDEIDSLSVASQAKLLRFLQEKTYRPLGSDRFIQADVTVVTATNRDLDALVREQRFRADLFFRLSVLRLSLTPLRERRDDIPLLARHFLDGLCAEEGGPRKTMAPAALDALHGLEWPGNVRELYNVVQRAFVFAVGPQIGAADIAIARGGSGEPPAPVEPADDGPEPFKPARARAVEIFERQYVIRMLKAHHGNITQAARSAGQDRRAFGRLVKRHHIDRRGI